MIRRFGAPPRNGHRYVRRAGAYALLPRHGQLLVTSQNGIRPDFQLPGGGLDPGEGPIHALHREVLEETGWRIARPRRVGAFRRFVFMPEYDMWAEKICLVYVARPICALGPPSERDHTAHWMILAEAARLLSNPGDRHFAAQFCGVGRHGPSYSNKVADTSSSIP